MSNYIYGFMKRMPNNEQSDEELETAIVTKSKIGFHLIDCRLIPSAPVLPDLSESVCFCLSDSVETLLATNLLFEIDWSPDYTGNFPPKLIERIELIVDQVKIIVEESKCSSVSVWLSESDQLEEIIKTDLTSLSNTVYLDFVNNGVPCKIYEIVL